jgi:putative ABC transport system permease protein
MNGGKKVYRVARRKSSGRTSLILACLAAASCIMAFVFGVERGFEMELAATVSQAAGDVFNVSLSGKYEPNWNLFDVEEMATIRDRVPSAEDIAAYSKGTLGIDLPDLFVPSIRFVTSNYFSVRGLKTNLGRTFTSLEEERKLPVAVAGASLVESGLVKVGEVYHCPMTGMDYHVVGSLALQQTNGTFDFENRILYVPLSLFDPVQINDTAASFLRANRISERDVAYPGVAFWVRPKPGLVEEAMAEIETALSAYNDDQRKIYISFSDIAQLVYGTVKEHSTGGLVAAGLAVLGVAVMNSTNLLLLDVVSLRKKIGIKRCIGAARIDIAVEVLGRTVALTLSGIALGLGLAFSVRGLFEKWFGEAVLLSPGSILKAVAVIVPVMVLAGLYPAIVSSRISPIQAVRDAFAWRPGKKHLKADVRSALAVAAVAIGVTGVVVMMGISYLTQEKVASYLKSVGERLVLVENEHLASQGVGRAPEAVSKPGSSASDSHPPLPMDPSLADNLAKAVGAYRAAWFQEIASTVALPDSNQVHAVSVVACSPSFASLRRFEVASGRFLLHQDDRTPVCVLGHRLAASIFGEEDCVGKTLHIGSPVPFTVVGVLKPRPQGVLDLSFYREDSVFIPPLSMLSVPDLASRFCENSKILLEAREGEKPEALVEKTKQHFAEEYPLFAPPRVDKYLRYVERMDEIRAKLTKVFGLTGILAIALSAIGVFAIMMARVTEKAREIGIRRAVGASKRNIMELYLREALGICLPGSVIGLVASCPILRLLEPLVPITFDTMSRLAVWAVAAGTASAALGGLHPARTAARTPPAEVFRA